MTELTKVDLARTAGLRDFDTPELEDVHRRRSQLWTLSLVVGVAIPAIIVALGFESLNEWLDDQLDIRTVRLVLLALLVALFGYVAEREHALRKLTSMLIDERVVTATLVARIEELDALLKASRAMNSTLNLSHVLHVILSSACELLHAAEGSIQLVDDEEPGMLRVVAVQGNSTARIGHRQRIGEGVAGGVAANREPVLVTGRQSSSRSHREIASALVVPLESRGELLGVLNLAAQESGQPFNEFQLRSVAVFAETAAASIANARAHEITEERVADLTELDQLKDEFLTLVTHELRTPLTSLIGLASTIVNNAERLESEQIRQLADMTRSQGWRLDRLVGDLLQSSQAQNGTLKLHGTEVDLIGFLAELAQSLQASAPDHRVVVDLPDEPLVRTVDTDAISRIVANLVGNAAKYTPMGTTVTITARPWADGAMLAISDEGPGIPPEERPQIFAKFRRGPMVTDATSGLGLGLYIVRSLAEAHGGEAMLQEAPGGGCQFVVTLGDLGEDSDVVPAPDAFSLPAPPGA